MSKDRPNNSGATIGADFDLDGDTIASRDEAVGSPDGQATVLPAGFQAGRYTILDQIGRGGMGVVYKAYDPELDRRIALKLLRVNAQSGSLANRARDRLLREAQALAQLSHPNVVAAYDVGTIGQDVFVAMELVEGWTLKQWIRESKPSVYAKVRALVAAGRGIEAAHAAGLIHRDVKPDNIIVGKDGRVRVLDFGLARAALAEERVAGKQENKQDSEALVSGELTSGGSFLDTPMTLAGTIVGTPGYMAPAQYRGQATDEQTDQYSFCVTLYEALYGCRPWRARKYGELKKKVLSGQLDPPPAQVKVPARFRRIVLRGLALAKEDRYRSMTELLAELAQDPRVARRRKLVMAAMVLLVGLAFGGAYAWQASKQKLCKGAGENLLGVWDDSIKQKVQKQFAASGRGYAQDTFGRVAKALDGYAHAWVQMRKDACEATHLRGEQSAGLLDLRMRCLDQGLGEMRALTWLFAEKTDAAVVDRAVAAVSSLAALDRCADSESLQAAYPPPADHATRERVNAQRKKLQRATALERAGKYKEGLAIVQAVAGELAQTDYAPLQAEAYLDLGRLQSMSGQAKPAEESLYRAARAAGLAKDSRRRAQGSALLIRVIGLQQARYPEMKMLGELARADVAQAGDDPVLLATTLNSLAVVYASQGQYDSALPYFQQALAAQEKNLGRENRAVAVTLSNLGNVLQLQGQVEEARKCFARALAIREKVLGPKHIRVAYALHNLAGVQTAFGHGQDSLPLYRRALAILENTIGARHPHMASMLTNLGLLQLSLGELPQARARCEQALSIWEQALGQQHPSVAEALMCLGRVLLKQGLVAQARKLGQRALLIREQAFGPDNAAVTKVKDLIAEIESGRAKK